MTTFRLKNYLLNKPEAVEEFPFGPDVAVYKVCGKIFALVLQNQDNQRINLKCDPLLALELRTVFKCVIPGYHMNKKHWNTVILDSSLPTSELQRMIDHSYKLVIAGLSKTVRKRLELCHGEECMALAE